MPKYHSKSLAFYRGVIAMVASLAHNQEVGGSSPLSATNYIKTMTKDGKIMTCIVGQTVRNIVAQVNELGISREDIVSMFVLGGQVYLVFYK